MAQEGGDSSSSGGKKVTMEELGQHGTSGDLWLLIDGKGEYRFLRENPPAGNAHFCSHDFQTYTYL